jgi:hypothetical protein
MAMSHIIEEIDSLHTRILTISLLNSDVTILPPFFHFSHSRDFTCP